MSRSSDFNYLFYILFFIGFCLPTNSNFYIPLPGVLLKFNEVAFLLLPLVNEFCKSNESFKISGAYLRAKCLFLVVIIFFIELIIKNIAFEQNIGDGIKSIRLGLSMLVTVYFIYRGINVNLKKLFNVFIYTLLISYFLTLLSGFVSLPIYHNVDGNDDTTSSFGGRIINSNFSFGLIGLYLLFNNRSYWYNEKTIHKLTYVISVIIMILSFNRTLMAASALMIFIMLVRKFNIKSILTISVCVISILGIVTYLYNTNNIIKNQLDKRVLGVIFLDQSLSKEVLEDNRDQIYEGIKDRIKEGYWLIGMDFKDGIFSMYKKNTFYVAKKTDLSFINIILRYGIFPLILYLNILYIIYQRNLFFRLVLLLYVVCSFNIDLLMNQNSIFFIGLFIAFDNLNKVTNIRNKDVDINNEKNLDSNLDITNRIP